MRWYRLTMALGLRRPPGERRAALGRRLEQLCLVLMMVCLPLQGMASVILRIDGVAHIHLPVPASASPARPVAALPPGLPVLLTTDRLHHSHGAPRHRAPEAEAAAAPHHHAAVAHHTHATDLPGLLQVDDPVDDPAAPGTGKRLLLDVDTPPAAAEPALSATPPARPSPENVTGRPDPAGDRLERPPRPTAA